MIRFFCAAILLLSTSVYAGPSPSLTFIVNDPGGDMDKYEQRVETLNKHNGEVVILGWCASACTMYLGVKHICISPKAQLAFHEARLVHNDGRPSGVQYKTGIRDEQATNELRSYYPPKISSWVDQHNALGSGQAVVMTGSEAISLGIPQCKGTK